MAQRFEITEVAFKRASSSVMVPVQGASAQIKDLQGNNLTVYANETGSTTTGNPITTDVDGRIEGWVEAPDFDITVSGTGFTTYTQKIRTSPLGVFHVSSYGARCDDTTDDYTAVVAARDAAATYATSYGSAEVVWPAGTCRLKGTTGDTNPHGIAAASNVTFRGAPGGQTILKPIGNQLYNSGIIYHPEYDFSTDTSTSQTTAVDNFHVMDVVIDGDKSVDGGAQSRGCNGIRLDGLTNCSFTRVTVKNSNNYGFAAEAGYSTNASLLQENVRFIDCVFENNGAAGSRDGIDFKSGENIHFTRCVASNNEEAGFGVRGKNVTFTDCLAYNNLWGFQMFRVGFDQSGFAPSGDGQSIYYLTNCEAYGNTGAGFLGQGVAAASGHDPANEKVEVYLSNCHAYSNASVPGFLFRPNDDDTCTILAENCKAWANATGFSFDSSTGTADARFRDCRMHGCVSRENTTQGVLITSGRVLIDFCSIIGNTTYGIRETGGTVTYAAVVTNSSITGNGTNLSTTKSFHNIASAGTITIPPGSLRGRKVFNLTGTTTVTAIQTAESEPGREITLVVITGLTIGNGSSVRLAGSASFVATADSTLTLVTDGGSASATWREVSRSLR